MYADRDRLARLFEEELARFLLDFGVGRTETAPLFALIANPADET